MRSLNGAQMPVRCGEGYPWRRHDKYEAVSTPDRIERSSLFPQSFLFGDFLGDLVIAPTQPSSLREETEMDATLFGCDTPKLTGLSSQAP